MPTRSTTRQGGFTLTEALVVIFIIGILAAILLPTISESRRRARLVECMNNLKQIGMALQIYTSQNNDRFPIWPNPTGTEFSENGNQYSLEATYLVQLASGHPDNPASEEVKIGLGCLYPQWLTDDQVLNDPGSPAAKIPRDALIDEERGVSQDVTVESGYYYVNADFETLSIKGPLGLNWLGAKTREPIAWCAQDATATRVREAHGREVINCLYMDAHVDVRENPPGSPQAWIVGGGRTVRDVLQAIKQESSTYLQEYPP